MPTPASDVIYTAPFTGAIARTAEAKFAERISVKDFGALGDGVTDDQPAFQKAVDYVRTIGGGEIFIPRGTYALSSQIDTTGANNMRVTGEGPDASVLMTTSATASVFFAAGSTFYRTFDNFSITSSVTPRGGRYIDFAFERRGLFHRLRLQKHFDAIVLRGFEQTTLSEVFIVAPSGSGTALICGEPSTSNVGANLNLLNCFFRGNNEVINDTPIGAIALLIYDVEAVFGVNSDFANFRDQIMVVAPQAACRNLHFSQTYFDGTLNGDNVLFRGAGLKQQFQFTGCWFNGAGAVPGGATDVFGANFTNEGTYADFNFTGCRFISQKAAAVYSTTPSSDFNFTGCNFYNCSTASVNYPYAVGIFPASNQSLPAMFNGCKFRSSGNALADFSFGANARGNLINGSILEKGVRAAPGVEFAKCSGNSDPALVTIPSASSLALTPTLDYFNVTGTTNINSIPRTYPGHRVTLVFTGTLTVMDGAGLHLAGNFTTTNGSVLNLVCEPIGGQWRELSRTNT